MQTYALLILLLATLCACEAPRLSAKWTKTACTVQSNDGSCDVTQALTNTNNNDIILFGNFQGNVLLHDVQANSALEVDSYFIMLLDQLGNVKAVKIIQNKGGAIPRQKFPVVLLYNDHNSSKPSPTTSLTLLMYLTHFEFDFAFNSVNFVNTFPSVSSSAADTVLVKYDLEDSLQLMYKQKLEFSSTLIVTAASAINSQLLIGVNQIDLFYGGVIHTMPTKALHVGGLTFQNGAYQSTGGINSTPRPDFIDLVALEWSGINIFAFVTFTGSVRFGNVVILNEANNNQKTESGAIQYTLIGTSIKASSQQNVYAMQSANVVADSLQVIRLQDVSTISLHLDQTNQPDTAFLYTTSAFSDSPNTVTGIGKYGLHTVSTGSATVIAQTTYQLDPAFVKNGNIDYRYQVCNWKKNSDGGVSILDSKLRNEFGAFTYTEIPAIEISQTRYITSHIKTTPCFAVAVTDESQQQAIVYYYLDALPFMEVQIESTVEKRRQNQPISFRLVITDPESEQHFITATSENQSRTITSTHVPPSKDYVFIFTFADVGSHVVTFKCIDAASRQRVVTQQIFIAEKLPTMLPVHDIHVNEGEVENFVIPVTFSSETTHQYKITTFIITGEDKRLGSLNNIAAVRNFYSTLKDNLKSVNHLPATATISYQGNAIYGLQELLSTGVSNYDITLNAANKVDLTNDGEYLIYIRIATIGPASDFTDTSLKFTVKNVAPTVSAKFEINPIHEGEVAKLKVLLSDPGDENLWTAKINWNTNIEAFDASIGQPDNDGFVAVTQIIKPPEFIVETPTTLDNFVSTITLMIFDGTDSTTAAVQIEVLNVAPKITQLSSSNIDVQPEEPIVLSGKFADPGLNDAHSGVLKVMSINSNNKVCSGPIATDIQKSFQLRIDESKSSLFLPSNVFISNSGKYNGELVLKDSDGAIGTAILTINVAVTQPEIVQQATRLSSSNAVEIEAAFSFKGIDSHVVTIQWTPNVEQIIANNDLVVVSGNIKSFKAIRKYTKDEAGSYKIFAKILNSGCAEVQTDVFVVIVSTNGFLTLKQAGTGNANEPHNIIQGPGAKVETDTTNNNNNNNQPSAVNTQPAVQTQQEEFFTQNFANEVFQVEVEENPTLEGTQLELQQVEYSFASGTPNVVAANEDDNLQFNIDKLAISTPSNKRQINKQDLLLPLTANGYKVIQRTIKLDKGDLITNINFTTSVQSFDVVIAYWIFSLTTERTISLYDTPIQVNDGAVKWAIEITSNTNNVSIFPTKSSILELDYVISASGDPVELLSTVTNSATSTFSKFEKIEIESSKLKSEITFPTKAQLDGTWIDGAVDFEAFQSNNGKSIIRFKFPFFSKKLVFDPRIDVVLNGANGGSSDDNEKTNFVIQWRSLGLFVTALIFVVINVLLYVVVEPYRQFILGPEGQRIAALQQARTKKANVTNSSCTL